MARILLIDDEELVRFSLRQILEIDGHEVDEAADGVEGLRHIRETAYDLVITDILMPGKEGVETIIEAKQDQPRLKIIAISGGGRFGNYDFLQLAQQFGADAILPKPFNRTRLSEMVNDVLARDA